MLSVRKILLLTFIVLLSFSSAYAATTSGTNIGNYATLQAFSGILQRYRSRGESEGDIHKDR